LNPSLQHFITFNNICLTSGVHMLHFLTGAILHALVICFVSYEYLRNTAAQGPYRETSRRSLRQEVPTHYGIRRVIAVVERAHHPSVFCSTPLPPLLFS
jgi:hypothetical protein